ncbi:MAG: hypothetical protein ABIJ91_05560 [Candidatus Kuenenbacteria bacterium]
MCKPKKGQMIQVGNGWSPVRAVIETIKAGGKIIGWIVEIGVIIPIQYFVPKKKQS